MTNPDPIYTLRGTGSPVTVVKFNGSSNENLYSGCEDGNVHIWNMHTRRIQTIVNAHPDHSVLYLDFINDKLVTQGRDGLVKFWSIQGSDYTVSGTLQSGSLGFCSSAVIGCNSTTYLAIPGDVTSQVDIYDCKTHNSIGYLKPCSGHSKYGMCMSIRSVQNEKHILLGYENGSVALWDIRSFKMIDSSSFHKETVMCMDFSSGFMKGLSGSVDNKIVSWKLTLDEDKNSKHLTQSEQTEVINPGFNDICIRDDNKIFATAGWDTNIRIFGFKKLKPLAVLSYHKQSVQCLTFSDDFLLACGSKDQYISLWDIYR